VSQFALLPQGKTEAKRRVKAMDMPLACFQCTDSLLFAAKHAKGMSLRYGVVLVILYKKSAGVFGAPADC